MPANVWINEVDYDRPSNDGGQFVEIGGVAGTSLHLWRISLYDPNSGQKVWTEFFPDQVIPDNGNGFGTVVLQLPVSKGQGIALVDDTSTAIQFISFGDEVFGSDSYAQGLTSTAYQVEDSDVVDGSLQLTGDGKSYGDFTWGFVSPTTQGSDNIDQSLGNYLATFSGDTAGNVQNMAKPVAAGHLIVTDQDSSTDVIEQHHVPSSNGYGTFSITSDGTWSYVLSADNTVVNELSNSDVITDSITVRSSDGTQTAIDINIRGISRIVGTKGSDGIGAPVGGTAGADYITALSGNDFVYGFNGIDFLVGGKGADKLFGGKGADHFVFDDPDTGFKKGARDEIRDFKHSEHDLIDLTGMDGFLPTKVDDDLKFFSNESAALKHFGSVFVEETSKTERTIFINDDTDHKFDLAINVHTSDHLTNADFLL